MPIYRCILPLWKTEQNPSMPRVVEGEFSDEEIESLNNQHYNIYFLPNYPSDYKADVLVDGSQVDVFRFVFVDMDLKDKVYKDKETFIEVVNTSGIRPTYIVDSGNGIHVYWQVTDLDAMSYLKLQRRLMRRFKTDEAVGQIFQLMRAPGSINTKNQDSPKTCSLYQQDDKVYTCEDLDRLLPIITPEDTAYCIQHYNKTYKIHQEVIKVDYKLPLKFTHLLAVNEEVKTIWTGNPEDRSVSDFRLGHLLFSNGLSKDEAISVLVNTPKAESRAPGHRISYATNIVDKIWLHEAPVKPQAEFSFLSSSVKDILSKPLDVHRGARLTCWKYFDNTAHGLRLGQVIGLIAGSGVGKTAVALNLFEGFVTNNPDYIHLFIALEQPAIEIANRWKTMCGEKTHLHDKVHILSNYNEDGSYRHISLGQIKDYVLKFQEVTGKKIGCVILDHIGALAKGGSKAGEGQDLMNICHSMKAFAQETNTLLVMQSQAPRQKAGIGDIELDKDAAYGTVFFESYCDYVVTLWQPLKRVYKDGAPTVTAIKFCKIRHKKQGTDGILEDVRYHVMFDPNNEKLRPLTEAEQTSFLFFLKQAASKRKEDRSTDLQEYVSARFDEPKKEATDVGKSNHN